jgi:hypothetical protein
MLLRGCGNGCCSDIAPPPWLPLSLFKPLQQPAASWGSEEERERALTSYAMGRRKKWFF